MKKLVVVLMIAVLALGSGSIYLWKELDAARNQNTALQARMAEMEKTRQAFAAAFTRRTEPAANDATDTAPTAPMPATAHQPGAARGAALIAGVRQMLASPEGREMARSQLRMYLPQMYPDIGKSLNLTPDQVSKLFDLLAKQQSERVGATDFPAGGARDPAAMQDMRLKLQQQQQTNDADVAALLGSKYPQYQEYQQTLPVHRQVNQLQTMLGSGDNSLSDSQATSLTTALAAEQQRINQDTANAPQGRTTAQDYLQRTTDNNQRLVDVASTHLNPQQLDSYKKMLDQQQSMAGVVLRAIGGQGAAQGQAGAATPAGQ